MKVGGRDEGSASDAETQLDAPEYDIELVDLLQFVGTREVVRSWRRGRIMTWGPAELRMEKTTVFFFSGFDKDQ